MFATLQDRLAATFKNLRGKGRLSEADIDQTCREIRVALLEADVALPVVKDFVAQGPRARPGRGGVAGAQPGAAGRQDRQRGAHRDPRRRDPAAEASEDTADRRAARGPAGHRQDDAGRQARRVAPRAGPSADAGRRRPAAAERGAAAADRGRAGRGRGLRAQSRASGVGDPVDVARDSIEHARSKHARHRHRRHRRPAGHRRRDDGAGRGHPGRRAAGRDAVRRRRDGRPGRGEHRAGVPGRRRLRRRRADQARRRRPRWRGACRSHR